MMKYIIVMIGGLLIFGCKNNKLPEEVLTHEEMVPLILDIYIAEGRLTELRVKRDSSEQIFEVYEEKIFEKHGIDKETYKKSMTYYYDHPQGLEKIYETVLDSLNLWETRLKEAEKEASKEKGAKEAEPETTEK